MLTILATKPNVKSVARYQQHELGTYLAVAPDGVIAGGCPPSYSSKSRFSLEGRSDSALPRVWLPHISRKFGESVQLF